MLELWPFTNFHDLNLDWIIKTIKVYTKKVDDLYNFGLYDFVEKVLTAHPEWTTTVMDGAITMPKLASDVELHFSQIRSAPSDRNMGLVNMIEQSTLLSGYSTPRSLQAICYNPDKNRIAWTFAPVSAPDIGCIVETDLEFNRTAISELDIGHANDITYFDGNYYIAKAESLGGEFCIVPASTLATVTDVTIPAITSPAVCISYDEFSEKFIVMDDGQVLYSVETDLSDATIIKAIDPAELFMNFLPDTQYTYVGGSAMIGDTFNVLMWLGSSSDDSRGCIAAIDQNGDILNKYQFAMANIYDEAEGLANIKNNILTVGYTGNVITIYGQGVPDDTFSSMRRIDYTTGSTIFDDIHDAAPSRNVYTYQVHFTNSHSILGGNDGVLTGCNSSPTSGYGYQMFMNGTQSIKYRQMQSNTWGEWKEILDRPADSSSVNRSTTLSYGSKTFYFYRQAHIVSIDSPQDLPSGLAQGYNTVGTLPAPFRPVHDVFCTVQTPTASQRNWLRIKPNGDVDVYSSAATTSASNGAFNFTYYVS